MAPRRRPLAVRFWSKVQKGDGCWLWLGAKDADGYGWVRQPGRSGRQVYAHRVAWELEHGTAPVGFVLHACDTPSCVRPDHLSLGDAASNAADRNAKGRQARGERMPWARLTEANVLAIRASREPLRALALRLGVTKSTISSARRGRTWKHVGGAA